MYVCACVRVCCHLDDWVHVIICVYTERFIGTCLGQDCSVLFFELGPIISIHALRKTNLPQASSVKDLTVVDINEKCVCS